jgi:hypothetical protein
MANNTINIPKPTKSKGSKGCKKSGKKRRTAHAMRYIAEDRRMRNKRAKMFRTSERQPNNQELADDIIRLFFNK